MSALQPAPNISGGCVTDGTLTPELTGDKNATTQEASEAPCMPPSHPIPPSSKSNISKHWSPVTNSLTLILGG